MKKCFKCKEEKKLDCFSKDKSKKDGYAGICKECKAAWNVLNKEKEKIYRSKNKEKIKNYQKEYYSIEKNIVKNQEYRKNYEKINNEKRKLNNKQYNDYLKNICRKHKVKKEFVVDKDRCLQCLILKTQQFIDRSNIIHNSKYTYNNIKYITNYIKVKITCNKHGDFEQKPMDHLNGNGCPQCAIEALSYSSQYEQEIINFIKEKSPNINIIPCYRLENKEIDIYLPDYSLGIEFNGLYWHSHLHKETNYHKTKSDFFESNNIYIFHIWENQWLEKKEIIKSMILNKLKLNQNKIYARKCEIREIDSKLYKEFCSNNHIQGYSNSKLKIGLFYQNELISCMSFGKLRVNLGNKKRKENHWELIRFCNKLNFTVVGAASRLLNWFEKNIFPAYLVSYADRDYSQGNLYFQLNFNGGQFTNIAYKYYNPKTGIISNRFNYRKSELVKIGYDKNLTEFQIINQMGLYRLNNSGILKFEKTYLESQDLSINFNLNN